MSELPPCVLFEDEHLLVVNKPAGINTHAPAPLASEGLYDWLRHREPRWGTLAILQRLDKETSGLIVFAKTSLANRSLATQFANRSVRKAYLLLTSRPVPRPEFAVRSNLVRLGERYGSSPLGSGVAAETRFQTLAQNSAGQTIVRAAPLTGRTHQIRVHAAEQGFPILGDRLYGGDPFARVCLHAAEIAFAHPATGAEQSFTAAPDFTSDPRSALREALIHPESTDCYRLVNGATDHCPRWFLDRYGSYLLSTSTNPGPLPEKERSALEQLARRYSSWGIYQKVLARQPGTSSTAAASPQPIRGELAPKEVVVRENGVRFALSFEEGYSVGLFLDQRDNRRRLLQKHISSGFPLCQTGSASLDVLNLFAYTCAFSVCAALAGAYTTSVDLSRKYLQWGKRNFELNGINPEAHEFIYGDAFDWLKRLERKQRRFDLVLLDPPTFSRSKMHGLFRVEEDYPKLVRATLSVLKPEGVLFVSTNAAALSPERFLDPVSHTVQGAGWRIRQQHFCPQPPDFPTSREEPAYLKTAWLRIDRC